MLSRLNKATYFSSW